MDPFFVSSICGAYNEGIAGGRRQGRRLGQGAPGGGRHVAGPLTAWPEKTPDWRKMDAHMYIIIEYYR